MHARRPDTRPTRRRTLRFRLTTELTSSTLMTNWGMAECFTSGNQSFNRRKNGRPSSGIPR